MLQFLFFIWNVAIYIVQFLACVTLISCTINAVQCNWVAALGCIFTLLILLLVTGVHVTGSVAFQRDKALIALSHRTFGSHLRKKGIIGVCIATFIIIGCTMFLYLFEDRVYYDEYKGLHENIDYIAEFSDMGITDVEWNDATFIMLGAVPSYELHVYAEDISFVHDLFKEIADGTLDEEAFDQFKQRGDYSAMSASYKSVLILLFAGYGICMSIIKQFMDYHQAKKLICSEDV